MSIFLRNDGEIRVLFDIERFITDKAVIEEFATIPGDSECKVFIRKRTEKSQIAGIFHPKIYLFFNENEYSAIVGSSNFTLGGLQRNIECNIYIAGKRDEFFSEIRKYFLWLWNLEYSIDILTQSRILEKYEKIHITAQKEENKKNKILEKVRSVLDDEINYAISSLKELINPDFAYLLGLMSGNSQLDTKNNTIVIDLYRQVANKGTENEGFYFNPDISHYKISQFDAHRKDVERIYERLSALTDRLSKSCKFQINHLGGYHFTLQLKFDSKSRIMQELSDMNLKIDGKKVQTFIPKVISESNDKNLIIAFLRGYCDLRSRISVSDGIYKTIGKRIEYQTLRMGISIPKDAIPLLPTFKKLFEKLSITRGISFTDPKKRTRENLIRIDVRKVPYELIGTHWKRIFLKDFIYYIESHKKKYNPNQTKLKF
ncbi:MAG: hypothetical protein HY769_07620 [Candidatus Stahlbacteria bacterium]|nr:hypothetical protein [Candidatus Stahlbacteria bacterium]